MYKLNFSQKLPIELEEAWDFFSSPENLEKITPESLSFKGTHPKGNKKIYTGQILIYSLKPLWNIEIEWVTEIVAVQKPDYFIDQQKFGPYAFWHHEHWFTPIIEGVLIEDIIYYKMPLGPIGRALHHLKIKNDLENIFEYRKKTLEKKFGLYSYEES